jgi:ligand-binding sensor domain-containing protein
VRAIIEDRQGDLWLGTAGGGLLRFDGARFTTYTEADWLASDDVAQLVENGQGNLWMTPPRGIPKGLTRLDRNVNQIVTYDAEDGLGLDIVETVTLDRDRRVWLATQGAPTRWDPVRQQFAQARDPAGSPGLILNAIHGGPSGEVWGGPLLGTLVYAWAGDRLTAHTVPVAVFAFEHLLEDCRGGLWVTGALTADRRGGLFLLRYDTATRSCIPYGKDQSYGGEGVRAIHEDRQGRVWLGTNRGLKRFDGSRFEDSATTGLGEEAVCAIREDREGHLWIGVGGGGLWCLDSSCTTYTTAEGLANNGVTQLLQANGHLLVGTKEGLSRLQPGPPLSFDLLSPKRIKLLRVDRHGRLWVSDQGSVSTLAPDGTEVLTNLTMAINAQSDRFITDALPGVHGDLWLANAVHGLLWIDQVDITEHLVPTTPADPTAADRAPTNRVLLRWTTLDGLPDNDLTWLALGPDGALWIGTAGGGASRYDGQEFHSYSMIDGLANDWVHDLTLDQAGGLWFATAGGLSHFDGRHWQTYRRADGGLPTDELRRLMTTGPARPQRRLANRHDDEVLAGFGGAGLVAVAPAHESIFREVASDATGPAGAAGH